MTVSETHPRISVVVPTYNRKTLLGETVQSILAQTFTDFELVIVDNMSGDGTEAWVKDLADPRIRYFKNDNHGVIAVNRNFGIRQARGEYIAFCDDDDLWEAPKLERQLAAFEEGISAVATNYIPFGDVQQIRKNLRIAAGHPYRDYLYDEILMELNPIISSSVIVRRESLVVVKGFDESFDFRFIEDWELWLRLSRLGKIRVLAEPLLRYRMQKKEGRDARTVCQNTLKIIEKHRDFGFVSPRVYRQAWGNCSVMIGKAFLDHSDFRGIPFFLKGLLLSSGLYCKLKSIMGLLLFCVPAPLREKLFEAVAYRGPQ